MAVVRVTAASHYMGLSTDVKPTAPRAGSTFLEIDKGATYIWDGTAWRLRT